MTSTLLEAECRDVMVPILGGEILLRVPEDVADSTLNKEIASQDIIRKKLLDAIERLERSTGSNRELLLCPQSKLEGITRSFLATCSELHRFTEDLASYQSAIPELEEARGDARTFFRSQVSSAVEEIGHQHERLFPVLEDGRGTRHFVNIRELEGFRKRLAKCSGMVRTELQKIFAHLFARDPRNLYRAQGSRSEQEILFRQFKRDVEVTERLYHAVRRLDTYMRGAIVPSDLLQLIADKIEREGSVGSLFEPDYRMFLDALIDEVLATLVPELQEALTLDGIWYDDFENIETKSKMLTDACIQFRALYTERYGLREEIEIKSLTFRELADERSKDWMKTILATFDTYRYKEVADNVRLLDQVLTDLEGSLLQWEKGVARRAFALESWGEAEPFQRRPK